jgi:hypothetical protein
MWIWVSNLLEVLQLPKSPYFEGEGGDGGPAVDGLRAHGYLFLGGGLTETLDYRFTIVLLCMCPLFLFYRLFLFSANCYVLV